MPRRNLALKTNNFRLLGVSWDELGQRRGGPGWQCSRQVEGALICAVLPHTPGRRASQIAENRGLDWGGMN
jgi:hypothetical protein